MAACDSRKKEQIASRPKTGQDALESKLTVLNLSMVDRRNCGDAMSLGKATTESASISPRECHSDTEFFSPKVFDPAMVW